jgi:preprotein translocase subunit SecG
MRKGSDSMLEIALIVVSILLIAIVLLQSNKASDASQIISGGNDILFQNQKERGLELIITRLTVILGIAFFVISFILYIK